MISERLARRTLVCEAVPREGEVMRRSPLPACGRFPTVRRAAAVAASLILLGGSVAACGSDGPGDTLDTFLNGWKSGDLSKVGFVDAAGKSMKSADVYAELT